MFANHDQDLVGATAVCRARSASPTAMTTRVHGAYGGMPLGGLPGIFVGVFDDQHRGAGRGQGPPAERPPPCKITRGKPDGIADPHALLPTQRQQHAAGFKDL